ncbi:Ig-like domain-containing protein [Marinilabilia sp.]|uniref:Ig-like domain-containing protein n=1 Tax=Marinilabilia sp. TaxID=2021252 RepID=UPI0025BAEF21|nr:Ig-like domain-containing protein [Marinilabilia sp.]
MKTLLLKIGLVGGMILISSNMLAQPVVTNYDPSPGEPGIPVEKILTLTFNVSLKENPLTSYFWPNNPPALRIINDQNQPVEQYISVGGNFYNVFNNIATNIYINNNQLVLSPINALDPNTTYYILIEPGFVYAQNDNTNSEPFSGISNPNTWTFTTSAGAPSWTSTYPIMTDQTTSLVNLEMEIDQNGSYFYVITNSLTQPTPANIEAGLNESGTAAELANSGSLTANTTVTPSIDISSLDKEAIYYLHIVATNGGEYTSIKSFDIDLTSPVLSSLQPADGAINRPTDTNITLTFSEKIFASNHTEITTLNIGNYIKVADGPSSYIDYTATFSNNDRTITLEPDVPLDYSTTYTINFPSTFEDEHENEQLSAIASRTFTTKEADLFVWKGADSSWNTATNWDEGTIPGTGQNIYIMAGQGADPVISTETVSLNNLTIEAGASLTQTGGSLTITGLFTLESNVDANASFLPLGGTLDVSTATTQFHQHIAANNRNYNFGVSAVATTKASAGITNSLFQYNNDDNTYLQLSSDAIMEPGTGYICRSDNSLIFTGAPVTSDLTVTVQRNNSGGLGWNIIANPFTATSDFTQLIFEETEIANSFWVWDNIGEKYNTYNAASGIGIGIPNGQSGIPSHQAFWVKVLPGVSTSSITFTKSSLQANSYSYLKSASSTLFPTFKMEADFNGNKDEMAVVFADDATINLGDRYDTEKKLTSNVEYCQIYTVSGTTSLAINGLSPSETEISLPLYFSVAKTGLVTFNIKDFTLPPNAQVILEDKELNDFITLNTENAYQFEVTQTGTNNTRFVLHFSGTTEVATDISESKGNANAKKARFFTNNSEIIAYIGQLNNPNYRLLDINGKLIDSGRLNPESENRIMVSRKGMVILIVESEKEKLEFKTVF